MTKGCGCDKKPKGDRPIWVFNKKPKGEPNQIWVYKKICDKTQDIPANSYLGKNGFAYHLIKKDSKEKTEYKAGYKFSNLITGEIVYYVSLYKVIKTIYDKKTNTVTKYLECASQYSYKSKVEQRIANNIINDTGNSNYNSMPDNTNEFNDKVIKNILNLYKKGLNKSSSQEPSVQMTQVPKSYNSSCVCNLNCGAIYDCNCINCSQAQTDLACSSCSQ